MSQDLIQEMRAGFLDPFKMGNMLLRLPLIAVQLGHLSLEQTDVYLHPATLEGEFIRDVVFALTRGKGHGMSTEEFSDKWFAGNNGALELLSAMIETSHDAEHVNPNAAQ
jgi:hypothetical protein